MAIPKNIFTAIPASLRKPLLREYESIVQNYLEQRWSPTELSGGRFCEIIYTILEGYSSGNYASRPSKPRNFVSACRLLESRANVPRSFQILIPRMLPALYEIRNNRGVGHVGGDVDPNYMDATAVISMISWIMAELVRIYHSVSVAEAQNVVDSLAERRIPLIWSDGHLRRVLNPSLSLKVQILLLLESTTAAVDIEDLFKWLEYENRSYFIRTVRNLHKDRHLEFDEDTGKIQELPPGSAYIQDKLKELI